MAGSLDSNGCDIENSFVLNLRLKHAMECRLCVSCGTSAIEIEERYRKSEKHKLQRVSENSNCIEYIVIRTYVICIILYKEDVRQLLRVLSSSNNE